jgi:hypothetical protein
MRLTPVAPFLLSVLVVAPAARADHHITRDYGGYVEEYKAKYRSARDHHERVIIMASAIRRARWCSASCR